MRNQSSVELPQSVVNVKKRGKRKDFLCNKNALHMYHEVSILTVSIMIKYHHKRYHDTSMH